MLGELEVQRWGDCRGTLLGLLAAYNYEASILAAAARLLAGTPLPATHPCPTAPPAGGAAGPVRRSMLLPWSRR